MGKAKIGLYCYLTADILTNVLQKCSLSSPLLNISFLSNPLNLICCHGNQKAKFAKEKFKIISSEALKGMKLKLCRTVHNICLHKPWVFMWGGGGYCFHVVRLSLRLCVHPWRFDFSLISWKGNDEHSSNFADTLILIRCMFIIEN